MYSIDLLKGRGIPPRGRTGALLVAAIIAMLPAAILLAAFGWYLTEQSRCASLNGQIAANNAILNRQAEFLQKCDRKQQQIKDAGKCLIDVVTALRYRQQWSPIISDLVTNMPDGITLENMMVRSSDMVEYIPDPKDKRKKIKINKVDRTMFIVVAGKTGVKSDHAVRDYVQNLRSVDSFKQILENLTYQQKPAKSEDEMITEYEIEFMLKPLG